MIDKTGNLNYLTRVLMTLDHNAIETSLKRNISTFAGASLSSLTLRNVSIIVII